MRTDGIVSSDKILLTLNLPMTELQGLTNRGAASVVLDATEKFSTHLAELVDQARESYAAEGGPRADATLPGLSISASCVCGMAVEKKGDLCPACEHKNWLRAPEATVALKDQGEPPYKREGNFRDMPAEVQP